MNDHSMSNAGGLIPPSELGQAWLALCEDTGVNVVVCDREGTVLFANGVAQRWLHWRETKHTGPASGNLFCDTTTTPALLRERRELCERVCERGQAVVYESICRNIRYRVTMRPVDLADGRAAALIISRRMQPWERIGATRPGEPEPVVVVHHDPGVFASLSLRELEVLVLIAEGLSYSEIAAHLHRSVRTIERHRDRLGQKLGANNRVQLARFAIRAGLAELPTPPEQAELEASGYDPLAFTGPVRRMADQRVRAG
ncbi:MAG: helix-turn-helix transcriptional regulator [Phycisphaerales bacterium]|nr:helix-turn-helix transcriptional regulator [Phycisphaerales bacterium]